MAKYYGSIGFAKQEEIRPGVWKEINTERSYYGEEVRNFRKLQPSGNVNDNINISVTLSIVSDPYANEHMYDMRYATYQGAKWKITDVEPQYPRLILTLGGLYNG
jgi:hypothetical protein